MSVKEDIITKLKFPENIRTRQGMYGSDGLTPDIDFRELVDNTVDLAVKNNISLEVKTYTNLKDNWNIVYDNGQGLPTYKDPDHENQPITIDLLTQINTGSNFNRKNYSLGMNGVGSLLPNALSLNFIVFINMKKKELKTLIEDHQNQIKDGGEIYTLHFQKGLLIRDGITSINKTLDNSEKYINSEVLSRLAPLLKNEDMGTTILFQPDPDLHESCKIQYHGYPFKLINSLFKYDKDLKSTSIDFSLNNKSVEPYDFKKSFDIKLVEEKVFSGSVSIPTDEPYPVKFIFEFGYSADDFNKDSYEGSVNLLKTTWGKHITIFHAAIGRAFNRYNSLISTNDSRLGLRMFVLTMAIEPLFNSQDKTKLSKIEDKGFDENNAVKLISDYLIKEILNKNKDYFDLLAARIIEYKRLSDKLSNLDLMESKVIMGDESDRRRAMSGEMARVYECTSKNWKDRELYIVEGDSAAGKIIQHRDKKTQSVLPLRGKLINTSGFVDETSLVDNKEVLAIINTIGCGVGSLTDVEKSKYGKIIIATDSDSDGCLLGDTLINTLKYGNVPISWLEEHCKDRNFYVKSKNPEGELVIGLAHSPRITKWVDSYYSIKLSNGNYVNCTGNHPFLLANLKYKPAEDLIMKYELEPMSDKKRVFVENIRKVVLEELIPVYDITVEDYYNFYLTAGCYVHNSHISNLILGLFFKHAPEMIKQGKIYKIETPYYKWTVNGKDSYFYYDEKDKIDFNKGKLIKLKGLGSHNDFSTKKYLLSNERRLIKINYSEDNDYNNQEAGKLLYSSLARKQLMEEHNIFERNL